MIPTRLQPIIASAFLLLAAAAVGGVQRAPYASAQAENRAGLVVQFSDGSTRQYCFSFPGESISGLDLLLKTGLPAKIEGFGTMGALVCKLGDDGCDYPGEACVCKSYGPEGVYWGYFHLREGRWRSSVQGASSYRVRPGEVDGWAWSAGKPPPVFSFDELCRAEQPPAPSSTPSPVPASATSVPPPPPATATSVPPTPTLRPAPSRTAAARPRPASPTRTVIRIPARPSSPTATRTPQPPTQTSTAIPRRDTGAEMLARGVAQALSPGGAQPGERGHVD